MIKHLIRNPHWSSESKEIAVNDADEDDDGGERGNEEKITSVNKIGGTKKKKKRKEIIAVASFLSLNADSLNIDMLLRSCPFALLFIYFYRNVVFSISTFGTSPLHTL